MRRGINDCHDTEIALPTATESFRPNVRRYQILARTIQAVIVTESQPTADPHHAGVVPIARSHSAPRAVRVGCSSHKAARDRPLKTAAWRESAQRTPVAVDAVLRPEHQLPAVLRGTRPSTGRNHEYQVVLTDQVTHVGRVEAVVGRLEAP